MFRYLLKFRTARNALALITASILLMFTASSDFGSRARV